MKVLDLLELRRVQWRELEMLCTALEKRSACKFWNVLRMGSLYRAACADLAMADAYQLPPNTVSYLHQLVARAHNQLYRGRKFAYRAAMTELFVNTPQRLYNDYFLRLAFVLFWGLFITSMFLARNSTEFSDAVMTPAGKESLKEMHAIPFPKGGIEWSSTNAGFYVHNNTGIGLKCFAAGLLFGIGGLFTTAYNAIHIGTSFGYASTLDVPIRPQFFEWVTAHGPFELTAIVMSAAAGMRMGFSLISSRQLSRYDALKKGAKEAFPTMMAAVILFLGAAFIEGFITPSGLPFWFKASVSAVSSLILMVYFIVLGYPRHSLNA
jgi:uncharacterized membrane protein SpoIIM required for sporulation